MLKLFFTLVLTICVLQAKTLTNPEVIFDKKCGMCHMKFGPTTYEEQKAMVAPQMTLAMKSVVIGVDAIEEPKNKVELKQQVITFLNDYLMQPHRDKSFCEDVIFNRFGTMPSMKGFISKEELQTVTPWIFEQFLPEQYK